MGCPVKFTVEHPLGRPGCAAELYEPDGLTRWATAVDECGFEAIAFTEHPAPSARWLATGGHRSLDPLAALSFCAAVTRRVRLLTYLLVLPYHPPLVVAKSIATVDRLSAGRLTVGVGGGYLRSESGAVGASFDDRGARLDEALDVLRTLWTGDTYSVEGPGFTAREVVSEPRPVQLPHPPLWIGGSGRNARRRAARAGQGWMPLMMGEQLATVTRTEALTTPADLAAGVRELHDLAAAAGRDPSALVVQVYGPQGVLGAEFSVEQRRDHLGELAEAGATHFVVSPPGDGVTRSIDALAGFIRDFAGG